MDARTFKRYNVQNESKRAMENFKMYTLNCIFMAVLHHEHFYFKPRVGIEKYGDIQRRSLFLFLAFKWMCHKEKLREGIWGVNIAVWSIMETAESRGR